jgi:hypothetical protein
VKHDEDNPARLPLTHEARTKALAIRLATQHRPILAPVLFAERLST